MSRPTKQFILDEIRRCADANGSVAVGKRAFEAETGIRESAWLGRYWVRWSEAVLEAGYEPRELQGKEVSDDDLLLRLALLTLDFGRYPTVAEMRMSRLNDPEFPNSKTVWNRLGPRAEQVRRLREFSAGQAGFESVGALLIEGNDHEAQKARDLPVQSRGHVYMIKSGRFYKIGRTNNMGRREYEIALQLPERVRLVHSFETDDPPGIERYWHHRFADRRMNGEWFQLTPDEVAAFKQRRSYM